MSTLNNVQEIETLKEIADKALIDFKKIVDYLNGEDVFFDKDIKKDGDELSDEC